MAGLEADVVIVGSGAGGGTVAARLAELAESGKRVIVLEKGRRLTGDGFNGRELEMGERIYRDGGGFMTADGTVSLAFAEAYGGSTLVYTGTSMEPPARVIEAWEVPGLEHADLVERTRRYAGQNNVHPEERLNDNNRLFAEGCRKLGWAARQFSVNTRGCFGSSLCNLGCPNDAKQGTHAVQLPAAEARGVEVITGAEVTGLGEGELEVEVAPDGGSGEFTPGRHRLKAGHIVLAAGAIGTPALMLRAGMGNGLGMLGRYFTCQPAQILVGRHESPISNDVGHPKSFIWEERLESERAFLEVCMYPPFITAKNMAGFGPDHAYFMEAFDRLQMILVLAVDPARPEHRLALDRAGRPVVHYRLVPETIAALVHGTRAAARIFFAAGATDVHAPCARPMRLKRSEADEIDERVSTRHFRPGTISVSAAHLMGGCRMGRNAADSVTDSRGRVHGRKGLYVADASLFPAALETNPYLTIMALADRVADAVIEAAAG